jgi:hypothetical protein
MKGEAAMTANDRITGIAWRFRSVPTLEGYKAFMAKKPVLVFVFADGHRDRIDLEVIPHSPMAPDQFYVLLGSVRIGDIRRWEAPDEVGTLWIKIEGKGEYWLSREAFLEFDHASIER